MGSTRTAIASDVAVLSVLLYGAPVGQGRGSIQQGIPTHERAGCPGQHDEYFHHLGLERVGINYPGSKRFSLNDRTEVVPLESLAEPGRLFVPAVMTFRDSRNIRTACLTYSRPRQRTP